jgi:ABC-type branched-subunit amino acid transport system substrate-binding protein
MAGSGLRATVVSLAAFSLVMTACSNDTSSGKASNNTTQTTIPAAANQNQFADLKHIDEPNPCVNDPGVSASTIKIGTIAVETGPSAQSFKPAEDGIKARVEKANRTGELGSRKISLVTTDDAGDVAKNKEVARQLVESDKVFAIIEDSPVSNGSAAYLNEKGVPVAGWHVGLAEWSQFPNMFTYRWGKATDLKKNGTNRNGKLFKTLGATKIALVGINSQASTVFMNQIADVVSHTPGLEEVYKTTAVTPDERDFTGIVQRIKDSGADGILTGMDFLQNTALSDKLVQSGVTMKAVVFPGGYSPLVLNLPGIEGATFGLEFKAFESNPPAGAEFKKYMPDPNSWSQVAYAGWLSGETLVQGIKDAGLQCPTRKAFINNLRLEKAYTGGGAFDPVNLADSFGTEFPCAYYVKVVNKKFVPLFDGKEFCGDPYQFH